MSSKEGIHATTGARPGAGPFIQRTAQVPLAIIKCRGDFGLAFEAKQANPSILTVGATSQFRNGIDPGGMDSWVEGGVSPEDGARQYYEAYKPMWLANPWIDIWEVWNEWPAHRDWQSANYIALMQLFIKNGDPWKLACFSESSGNPPDFLQPQGAVARAWRYVRNLARGDDWAVQQMIPALKEAKLLGHYLSLHEYGDGVEGGYPFHTGRYKALYEILREHNAHCKLIITESGFVEYPGIDMFMARARYLDDLYAGDDFLKGSAFFTVGDWYEADIPEEALEHLAEHIVTYTPPDTPPDPEEKRTYTRHVVLIPQETTPVEDAEIANRYASTVTVLRSADDAFIIPGPEWPTQIKRLLVETWAVERVAHVDGFEEAQDALNDFIDTYHPVRESDIEFVLDFFEFGGTQPLPPLPLKFWLDSPIEGVDAADLVVTSHFNDVRSYGKHEGMDLQSWNHDEGFARHIIAPQDGEVHAIYPVGSVAPEYIKGYGNYVILRHLGPWEGDRIYYTWHCHLKSFNQDLRKGQQVLRGDDLGVSGKSGTGTDAIHWHGNVPVYMLDSNGNEVAVGLPDYIVDSVIDPEPLFGIDPTEPPPEPPTAWQGIRGVGWRADGGAYRQLDDEAFRRMNIDGVKLQTSDDQWTANILVKDAKIDPDKFLIRFFVPPAKWGEVGYTPERFVEEARLPINESWPWGIRWFELLNEPNLTNEYPPNDAKKFTRFVISAALLLKEEWPEIKLVSPALSPQANTESWWGIFSDLGLFGLCDGLGAHHYGADANDLLNGRRSYLGLEKYLRGNQQIHLTEFSINRASETDATKGQAYIDFWDSLESVVARADIFVLSAAAHGDNLFETRRETLVRQTDKISEIVTAIGAR